MEQGYIVYYYISSLGDNPVKEFIDSLSEKQQVKVLRIFQYLKQFGFVSIIPHIKKLTGTNLYEIRILGKDNIRIIYIAYQDRSILVLHGFIKKTQKTTTKEISIAIARYEDWRKRTGKKI